MDLTQTTLKALVSYDPDTGHFTRSRVVSKRWRSLEGTRAGCVRDKSEENSYRLIYVGGRMRYEHRLAWFYVHGEWPEQIDHINGDRSDNRLANLRVATKAQNARNSKLHRDNVSGYAGVRFHKPSGLWQAYISANKTFRSLGYFKTPEEAAEAREAVARPLYGDFHPEVSRNG